MKSVLRLRIFVGLFLVVMGCSRLNAHDSVGLYLKGGEIRVAIATCAARPFGSKPTGFELRSWPTERSRKTEKPVVIPLTVVDTDDDIIELTGGHSADPLGPGVWEVAQLGERYRSLQLVGGYESGTIPSGPDALLSSRQENGGFRGTLEDVSCET